MNGTDQYPLDTPSAAYWHGVAMARLSFWQAWSVFMVSAALGVTTGLLLAW